jgi:hypothetical protein
MVMPVMMAVVAMTTGSVGGRGRRSAADELEIFVGKLPFNGRQFLIQHTCSPVKKGRPMMEKRAARLARTVASQGHRESTLVPIVGTELWDRR